jgi:anti-sigma-K factor RskA
MSDIHKLSGAYALDGLDELERARFEHHLASCEDCRAEVAELRETAAMLAESVATPAPDALRESVLAGISQVRPLPPEVHLPVTAASGPSHAAGRRRLAPFLVAAALAILVGIGAAVTQPWSADRPDDRLTAAQQVLQADDAEAVFHDLGDAGRATVTRSRAEDRAVIVTEDMVAAPTGKVYELWLMDDDGVFTSAGLMPDVADQTVVLNGSAAEAAAVGITVEPDGGSEQPTTAPIALFDLTEAA